MNAHSHTALGGFPLLPLMAMLGACTTGGSLAGDPVYSTRLISASDGSGVASIACPATQRIVGGGCSCEGVGDVLFGSEPAGNGLVCGCYDFGPTGGAATATAICLGSSVPGTLTQGLAPHDPAVVALVERYRALREGTRSP